MSPTVAMLSDDDFFEYFAQRLAPYLRARFAADAGRREERDVRPPETPYILLQHAKYALRNGEMTLDEWAATVRAQGFRHRREPKNGRQQLPQSLRSLVSPSQHPEIFEALSIPGEPTRYRLRP